MGLKQCFSTFLDNIFYNCPSHNILIPEIYCLVAYVLYLCLCFMYKEHTISLSNPPQTNIYQGNTAPTENHALKEAGQPALPPTMACALGLRGETQAAEVFPSVGLPGLLGAPRQRVLSLHPQLCAVPVHAGDCGAVLLPPQGVRGLHGVLLGHGLDQHALLHPWLPADGHLCRHD